MIDSFLKMAGWADAARTELTPDWSTRQYWRLTRTTGENVILLICPPDSAPDSMPGHKLGDLIRINGYLKNIGLSAATTIASDQQNGYALLEDFGSIPMDKNEIVPRGTIVELLILLNKISPCTEITIPNYSDAHIPKKLHLFAEYVLHLDAKTTDEFYATCCDMMARDPRRVFTHVDFRGGNLHVLPDRTGIRQIGLLDTQGAVWGPVGYDLMTFLEDRRENPDMDADEKQKYIAEFCAGANIDPAWFETHYAVWRFLFRGGVWGQLEKRGDPDQARLRRHVAEKVKRDATHPAVYELLRFLPRAWHG